MYDFETNTVYFSEQIKGYRKCFEDIVKALNDHNVRIGNNIKRTKDIWARDYMPIQISKNKFVRYKYSPDYLLKSDDGERYLTKYPELPIGKDLIIDCNVILDGGNIVICGNKVIMTEKVFQENALPPSEITRRIEEAFGKQVIWIPCDPHEIEECRQRCELPLCHADGILHAIGDDTILLSNYKDYDLEYRKELLSRLRPYFKIKEFHFGELRTANSWIYINYLQVGNVVLMPVLGEKADDIAQKQLKNYLQEVLKKNDFDIIPINSKELTFEAEDENVGGSLHCISWNIFEPNNEFDK